ncbi:MAG: sulfatase-like hydrolase/transferase [Deltaproteobacteria bacterium]|nr:sulfatase-like hydrolase/transferase [Deltaproteobacteria bacterium]
MLPTQLPTMTTSGPGPYRDLRDGLRADVGRAIAMAAGGALAFAPIEYALTLWAYAGPTAFASKLRLVALVGTLSLVLFLGLALGLAALMVVVRLVRARLDPTAGHRAGMFAPAPLARGVRPGVPVLWATVATALVAVVAIQRAGVWALIRFKEPQLTAGLLAVISVLLMAAAFPLHRALATTTRIGAEAVANTLPASRLQLVNPLGRWRAAGIALAGVIAAALIAAWYLMPPSRSVMPVRLVISAVVIGLGMGLGAHRHAARTPTLSTRSRRQQAGLIAAGAALLATMTLLWWGADLETKYVAITASPTLGKLIGVVRVANDLDRDGYGSLLGEADCAPFTRAVHPGAVDIPSDGIDQNCDGRDFSLADIVAPPGPHLPVPEPFKRDWNILLLTIDTVRYDRTSFGGYRDGPKRRDTTPRLAELVKQSASFTFAHAPSAGTMASIPAILTSKYFHSGIAIDEKRPAGTPPGIMPENTLLPEIMKRAGYRTGVIGSHVWWNGWGLEQGVDDFDNSIAKTDDPRRVAADKVTDHVLAWVSRNQANKWFMWAHYIDPHGYYIAHPNVADYGSSDSDLYDAELKWTDQQVGRLLDELRRLPSFDRTIVIITSDHGESMGEHNVPLGTHGSALYREQLHVPLIFFIPDNKPRQLRGAVTNLDIVPTVAELVGADVSDLSFEGRSLVGALFYGKEDRERIVFAETNAGGKQRAAISESWRLIYHLSSNVYELFDQRADPNELTNLAPQNPPAMALMKRALEAWMDRVLYARDPVFNQAYRQMADVILRDPPTPPVATTGQTLAGGKLEILGIGPAAGKPLAPGAKTDIHVYFRVIDPVTTTYRFQLTVWPTAVATPLTAATPGPIVRSASRATADGAYPTERWRKGDHIRERFSLVLPADWKPEGLTVGLVATDATGTKQPATAAAPANDPKTLVLGVLPLGSSAPAGP